MFEYRVLEVNAVPDSTVVDVTIDLGFHMTTRQRVKLIGVHAPSVTAKSPRCQALGRDAVSYIKEWFERATDKVIVQTDFENDRTVSGVFRHSCALNTAMVERGYAYSHRRFMDRDDEYAALLGLRGFPSWEDYLEGKIV